MIERLGLVTIVPAEHDRRARLVTLTRQGMAKLREGIPYWKLAQQRFEEHFGNRSAMLRSALFTVAYNASFSELDAPFPD